MDENPRRKGGKIRVYCNFVYLCITIYLSGTYMFIVSQLLANINTLFVLSRIFVVP